MKETKLIDLLVKMANGEEVPNLIKIWSREYKKVTDEQGSFTYEDTGGEPLLDYCYCLSDVLNDKVIILDDIEELNKQ